MAVDKTLRQIGRHRSLVTIQFGMNPSSLTHECSFRSTKRVRHLLVGLVVFLAACSSPAANSTQVSPLPTRFQAVRVVTPTPPSEVAPEPESGRDTPISSILPANLPKDATFKGIPEIGGQLAFASSRSGMFSIYLMDFATGAMRQLTSSPEPGDAEPFWSPDGKQIAFVSGDARRNYQYRIDAIASSGSGRRTLVQEGSYNGAPSYSPDGSKLLFHSNRDGNFEVYVANSDGSAQTNLSNHPANDAPAVWFPGGNRILFASDRGDGNFRLYVMEADGSGQRLFFERAGHWVDQARFSPSGQRLAVTIRATTSLDIHIALLNADGTGFQQVTGGSGQFRDPFWIDEETLLVSARTSTADYWHLFLLSFKMGGLTLTPLTFGDAHNRNPVWHK